MSKDIQEFLEVDQDLRRIGSQESNFLPICRYGSKCTRKNPTHFKEFRHPRQSSSSPEPNKNKKKPLNQGPGPAPKKTPKKCSLPLEKNKSSTITNYFKPKSVIEANKNEEKQEITPSSLKKEEVPVVKSKSIISKDDEEYLTDDSDIPIDEDDIAEINLNRFGKRSLETDSDNSRRRSSKSLKKFATNKNSKPINNYSRLYEPKQNNLNHLMPNIDKILSKPDNLIPISPLDIPSSSSSEQSLPSPKKVLLKSTNSLESKRNLFESKKSNQQYNDLIRKIFLVKMPEDFFTFWSFCKEISPINPQDALVGPLGLKLVGPFDVLNGKLNESNIIDKDGDDDEEDSDEDEDQQGDSILTHWRFYFDPPEMQTFAVSTKVFKSKDHHLSLSYHLGYFRDTPDEIDPVVVSNDPEQHSCEINGQADNIFAAINNELYKRKSILAKINGDSKEFASIKRFETKFKAFAERLNIDLKATAKLRKRKKLCNAPTFHKFGILVPIVKDVGYRELPETDQNLGRLFKKIVNLGDDEVRRKSPQLAEIQRIMTLINYANDEKDFGMGLEFGLDLFCAGHEFFHRSCRHLLELAYQLLNRDAFGRILKAHLDNRRRRNTTKDEAENIVDLSAT